MKYYQFSLFYDGLSHYHLIPQLQECFLSYRYYRGLCKRVLELSRRMYLISLLNRKEVFFWSNIDIFPIIIYYSLMVEISMSLNIKFPPHLRINSIKQIMWNQYKLTQQSLKIYWMVSTISENDQIKHALNLIGLINQLILYV